MENNSKTKIKKLLNSIKGVTPKHCDVCGTKYHEVDFKLVREESQNTTIHIKCHECGNSYMLNIYNPIGGLIGSTRAQINLDLVDTNELMTFAGSDPITIDDALDAYGDIMKRNKLVNFLEKNKPTSFSRSKHPEKKPTSNNTSDATTSSLPKDNSKDL